MEALADECRRQGFKVVDKKKGWMIQTPNGKGAVMLHRTPSDHRALPNAISRLKRYGFKPPGR